MRRNGKFTDAIVYNHAKSPLRELLLQIETKQKDVWMSTIEVFMI